MKYIFFGNDEDDASSLSSLGYKEKDLKFLKSEDLDGYIPSLDDILIISVKGNGEEVKRARERISKRIPFLCLIDPKCPFISLFPTPEVYFLQKPFSLSDFRSILDKMTCQKKLSTSLENIIVGTSEDAVELRNKIVYESSSKLSLHIYGETGTGKTMSAKLVHSTRCGRKKNFVYVNCANLDSSLSDADLFGHTKGAYTGAGEERVGYIEAANGSTLMLDEIENLPLSTQAKLLNTIETGRFRMVGSNVEKKSTFRLITAGQKSLEELVGKNKLRLDLYYRICKETIYIKPLRYHKEDIKDLVEYFKHTNKIRESVSPNYNELYKKDWKGNVRELFSYLETIFAPYIFKEKSEAE